MLVAAPSHRSLGASSRQFRAAECDTTPGDRRKFPVAGHVIARAVYLEKTPIWSRTGIDEWGGRTNEGARRDGTRES